MHQPGDDVLAGVVLHPPPALLIVQLSPDLSSHGQRPVGIVEDTPALLVHVQHPDGAQRPRVGQLPAALREKGRAVQLHGKAGLRLLTGEHPGLKNRQVAVQIIELLGHVVSPLCTEDELPQKANGLPRQCAHWLAMT